MDFRETVESTDNSVLQELEEAAKLGDAFRHHVMEGFQDGVVQQELCLTFHDLLADDPNLDDTGLGEYGYMLAKVHIEASGGLLKVLGDHAPDLKEICGRIVRDAIDKFRSVEFTEADDDDEDEVFFGIEFEGDNEEPDA
ncbi:MAG: hypothetical protein HDQ87_05105 [Clostridia bacterium]|nr:hypothetical protein [Clostridia bacterium]